MIRRARASRAAAPVIDPEYQALKALVIARTGHHYYFDKDDLLWEHLSARMRDEGVSTSADYLERLRGPDADAAWRALESALTINETFFFRFAEQFDVLRRVVLPELIARHRQDRQLRIWSVGCSTGAEPYSVAVLLDDLLGDRLADWRISITGTDIDEAALATARSARFTSWALRTLGVEERARLFDREGSHYRLKPRYRGMARFEWHNLMTLHDPAAALQFTGFDLILCRNVLIYFRSDVATELAGLLAERLAPEGYLFVGHAEAAPEFAAVARPVDVDGVLAYQRLDAPPRAGRAAPPPLDPGETDERRPVSVPKPARPRRSRPAAPVQAPAAGAEPADAGQGDALEAVRAALALGDAGSAVLLAQREVDAVPGDPVRHYLAALGAIALGEAESAERGFRNALYLDNRFAMAHYLLGRHLQAGGHATEARRAYANALRIVAALAPDTELPEGDGMTAGGLAAAVRSALR